MEIVVERKRAAKPVAARAKADKHRPTVAEKERESLRAFMREVTSTPEKAKAFFIKHKLMDKDGKRWAKPYRD